MACVTNTIRFGLVWIVVGVFMFVFLPWWLSVPIFLIPIVVLGVIAVVMLMTLGKVAKGLQDAFAPKETQHEVAAGQQFDCDACSFTLPMAARVTQVAGYGISMVRIQPDVAGASSRQPPMILASNAMSAQDMQQRLEPVFTELMQLAPNAQVGDWEAAPEFGPAAMLRRIDAVKDGKPVRCQAVLDGEGGSLLAWTVLAPVGEFESIHQQIRDLARLVEPKAPPADVEAEITSSSAPPSPGQ